MELRLDKIFKAYHKKEYVLRDISVSLSKGIYGILGENGVGKSTLMRIMATADRASHGEISYDGESVMKMGNRYRDILGYLPQNFDVYENFSGEDYLHYISILKGIPKEEVGRKVRELLEFVNLYEDRKEKVINYSGGMKRRIGIAQAIINNPKILILDEPTAGLDPVERLRFYKILSYMSSDRIIILSTHIVADIDAITDHVIIMKKGRIIENGNKSKLLENLDGRIYEATVKKEQYLGEFFENKNIFKIHIGDSGNKIRYLKKDDEKLFFPDSYLVNPSLEDYFIDRIRNEEYDSI